MTIHKSKILVFREDEVEICHIFDQLDELAGIKINCINRFVISLISVIIYENPFIHIQEILGHKDKVLQLFKYHQLNVVFKCSELLLESQISQNNNGFITITEGLAQKDIVRDYDQRFLLRLLNLASRANIRYSTAFCGEQQRCI